MYAVISADLALNVATLHAQCEWGKVIGVGVHYIYICLHICLWTKNIESYFSDRLTLSNIHGRTSRRSYRLSLPLRAPETSLSSKSRIFLYNEHLALFVQRITQFYGFTNSSVGIVI